MEVRGEDNTKTEETGSLILCKETLASRYFSLKHKSEALTS